LRLAANLITLWNRTLAALADNLSTPSHDITASARLQYRICKTSEVSWPCGMKGEESAI
jgi:hypothetical protein